MAGAIWRVRRLTTGSVDASDRANRLQECFSDSNPNKLQGDCVLAILGMAVLRSEEHFEMGFQRTDLEFQLGYDYMFFASLRLTVSETVASQKRRDYAGFWRNAL